MDSGHYYDKRSEEVTAVTNKDITALTMIYLVGLFVVAILILGPGHSDIVNNPVIRFADTWGFGP